MDRIGRPRRVTSPARSVARNELEEGRVLAAGLLLLIQEREVVRVELLEPVVPGDRLEVVLAGAAGEVDAQHAGAVAVLRAADGHRPAVVLLDPAPDLVVI